MTIRDTGNYMLEDLRWEAGAGAGARAQPAADPLTCDMLSGARKWAGMGPEADQGGRERRNATLGGLLYADQSKNPVSETDWVALVASIGAGDQQALHALYQQTNRMVFTLIVRITDNRETAEELTLDVFHDVWRRAASYQATAEGSVVGWIMNQARSRAIDRVRFEQRKKRVNPDPNGVMESPAAHHVHEELAVKEQGRLLRNALKHLTPGERQAIETAYFSERTYAEVAEDLNQPVGTIKTRIRSGLKKLRQALSKGEIEA